MSDHGLCAHCDAPVRADETRCSACGERLQPLAPGGASLQVGEQAAGEERRHVTILFADLVNNTPLAERLDPEDMRRVLDAVFDVMSRAVLKLEGTVDKYVGDAVMAVFGAPRAHEDDAVRAVTAAVAMQRAIAELGDDLERRYGSRLSLRVGVNTGEVVAGMLAHSVQTAYTVVGDAVNVAQRLQSAAHPGEILVGERTRELVAQTYQLESRPALSLKGKSGSLVAYAVVGAAKPRSAPNALVGRAAERAHLVEAIERVCAGSGGVVAVVGEAGIGKSRLLGEARSAARDANATWLEGHSTSYGRSLSYLPFRGSLRAYAQIADGDDAETTWTKLREFVSVVLADQTDELLPYLATLIGIRPPEGAMERLRPLDAEALRRQVFRSAYALFEGMARAGPTILALEDWHWADPSSEQLLAHLLPLTNKLLLCWTGRSEPSTAVARAAQSCARSGMRYLEIRLLPLTEAESMKMVGNLFGANVPPTIADRVTRRAEGNPFFIQELVRNLIERGMLRRTGATTPTSFVDSDVVQEMPASVQATLAARLDGLSAAAREAVRVAAVIGRTFSYAMLRDAHVDGNVDGALAELLSHGLIRERAQPVEPAFAFTHSLIQESAYASILHERRRSLHRRVAEIIRTRAGNRTEDVAGLLAYHFTSAEDWDKAQGYLFAVGDQALRIAADAEAIDLYERALDAYARAFGASWDPFERAVVERKIGEARYRLGEFVVATRHLDRALELLRDPRPRTPGGVRAAIAREFGAQTGHRLSGHLVRPLVASAAREEILQALWTLQLVDYASDFERLSYDILRALNLAERLPPSHRTLRAYFGMTLICHNIGIGRVGTGYARMSDRLARKLGDPLAHAIASASLGLDHYAVGRYDDAARALRSAAAGYRVAGDLEPWAAVMAYLNAILATQGLLGEAFPIGGELESVGRAANDRRMQAFGPHCRAHVLAWAGRSDLSRAEFERALAMYAQIPDHLSTLIASGEFANLLLRIGELDAARVLVDRGEQLARDHNLRGWWLTPLLTAKAGAELGSAETSDGAQRRSFLAGAERTCARLRSQGRLHAEALPPAYRQIGTLEWLRAKPAAAHAAWARSLELAERFGATSEAFETHQTVARLTSSASDDVAATELANRMRAGFGSVLT